MTHLLFYLAACPLLAAALPSFPQDEAKAAPSSDDYPFVFEGTVQKKAASTVAAVKSAERTAVVKVTAVLHPTTRDAKRYVGKEITVVYEDRQPLPLPEAGAKAVFSTKPLVSAESLAVKGVAALTPEHIAATRAAALARPEQTVLRQIAKADLVVTGKVVAIRDPSREVLSGGSNRVSTREHAAQWREAEIEVQSVEKGEKPRKNTVHVLFPASPDASWKHAPKFTLNQEGTWLLHKDQSKNPQIHRWMGALTVQQNDAFTALDSIDFHKKEESARIKALVQKAQARGQ
jgi:hypothetical protein